MSFSEDKNSDLTPENTEQEDKVNVEETSINLGYVKKELIEELQFEDNQYKIALTFENVFKECLTEQKDNRDSLIGFLDGDIIMETGSVKLEDVEEENKDFIRQTIEQSHFETIQCCSCKVWLEKQEHLEGHMLHCLENHNRLSHNLTASRPINTGEEDKVCGIDKISSLNNVDTSYSTLSTEIVDSKCFCEIDCKGHKKTHFHGDHIRNQHSNTSEKDYKCSECSYQTNLKGNLKLHLNTHKDIKAFECDICKKKFTQRRYLNQHIAIHSNTSEKEYKCSECFYESNYKHHLKMHLNTHNDIKPFECDICKKRFAQKSSLKQHIQNKHSNTHKDIKPFECDICKKRFTQKSNLLKHVRNLHSDDSEMEYKCSECSYQTNRKDNLRSHLNMHNGIKPFECDFCKKGFTQKSTLQQHTIAIHTNTNEKEYKCSECSYQTHYKISLKLHLNTHNAIRAFECDICKKKFTRNSSLKVHIQNKHLNTHNDIKTFECDVCKKRFNQKGHLKVHIRTQHSNAIEKKYKCSECSYQTNHKHDLRIHLNMHKGIKPFECDICKKKFTLKSTLQQHTISIHSDTIKKEYKCSECLYETNLKGNLKLHLNMHKDIKPFECDICKKRFTQRSSQKCHIQNKHSNIYVMSIKNQRSNTHNDIKTFVCDICKKKFTLKRHLQMHMQNHHSNTSEKKYKCSECLYQTNYKHHLKLHLNTHNDIKPFECDICKMKFTQKGNMKKHVRNQHSNSLAQMQCLYNFKSI